MPRERRELLEIVTRYKAEPKLRGDIYVEGSSDKRFLDWFLNKAGSSETAVYKIDTVNIPEHILEEYGLPLGSNRSRVIALAQVLAERVSAVEQQVAFVIDRDLDDYVATSSWAFPSLFLTDYTSLEGYLFEEAIIQKFLNFVARRPKLGTSAFMDNLAAVLTEVFLVRLANASLGTGVRLLHLEGSCSLTGEGYIEFDFDDYLNRCITSSGQYARLAEFKSETERYSKTLSHDPRLRMHGHDLVAVLYWFSHQSPGSAVFRTPEALEAALFMSMGTEQLHEVQLLTELLDWADVSTS